MDRTATRRDRHHVALPDDADPADVRTRAGGLARCLLAICAGCPDALSAERVVSDLAAAWSPEDTERVVCAIEAEEPDDHATAALHAIAWTLQSPAAATLLRLRAEEGQLSPPWAGDLGAAEPVSATGTAHAGERLAFLAFDGPDPHVLAVGTFGGRRSRLGLLRPELIAEAGEPMDLEDARGVLVAALGPGMTLCSDGGPDLRHLAQRRLEAFS
jgi:hypothetical protein